MHAYLYIDIFQFHIGGMRFMAKAKSSPKSRPAIFVPDFSTLTPRMQDKYRFKIEDITFDRYFPEPVQDAPKQALETVDPVKPEEPDHAKVPVKDERTLKIEEPVRIEVSVNKEELITEEKSPNVNKVVELQQEPRAELLQSETEEIEEIEESPPSEKKGNPKLINDFVTMLNTGRAPIEMQMIQKEKNSPVENSVPGNQLIVEDVQNEVLEESSDEQETEDPKRTEIKALIRRLSVFPPVLQRPNCEAIIRGESRIIKVISKRGNQVKIQGNNVTEIVEIDDIEELKVLTQN